MIRDSTGSSQLSNYEVNIANYITLKFSLLVLVQLHPGDCLGAIARFYSEQGVSIFFYKFIRFCDSGFDISFPADDGQSIGGVRLPFVAQSLRSVSQSNNHEVYHFRAQ